MKNIGPAVIGTTIYLIFYTMMPSLGIAMNLIFLFFFIGNALLIYMVYVVLKYGKAPKKTFEEGYWYDDLNKKFEKEV